MEVIIAPKVRSDILNPELSGSTSRPEIADNCRTYHLYFSRKSAGRSRDRIRQPRHFLLYRVAKANILEIGRVLHESMELEEHLPDEYRAWPE